MEQAGQSQKRSKTDLARGHCMSDTASSPEAMDKANLSTHGPGMQKELKRQIGTSEQQQHRESDRWKVGHSLPTEALNFAM